MAVNYNTTKREDKELDLRQLLSDFWECIAINNLEIVGLEEISDTLTSEIMMRNLYEKGNTLFFKDKTLGYMSLPAQNAAGKNVYNLPVKFRAIGLNYNKEYNIDNSVLIKNNSLGYATKDLVDYYVDKLVDIELTKDMRLDAHKIPMVIECSRDMELTAKNIINNRKKHGSFIIKNKAKNSENDIGINAQSIDPVYILDKLEDEYQNYIARILTVLGLDNYVEDKAERVQSAEVESVQEFIIASFRASLETIKKGIDKVNEMFGLNLSVKYVQKEQIETSDEMRKEDEEVVEDE